MIDKEKGLGRFCSYRQATYSATAQRLGIENVPTEAQWTNMQALYAHVIEPIMLCFGQLPISSLFRCPRLNAEVGGSTTSAHMLGQAVDIDADGTAIGNEAVVAWAKANLPEWDQIILEYPDQNGKPSWVHISYRTKGVNRKQVLRARYVYSTVKGKTVRKTVYDKI